MKNRLNDSNLFQDKGDDQIIRVKDDDAKFELSLDTHGFRPDEIKVSASKMWDSIQSLWKS